MLSSFCLLFPSIKSLSLIPLIRKKIKGTVPSGDRSSIQNLHSFADNWDVMAIEEKVKEILIAQLDVKPEQITPQARIVEDLGADSLDTIELVMAFEEEYGIEIPDEKSERLRPVGDVIEYLTETLNK